MSLRFDPEPFEFWSAVGSWTLIFFMVLAIAIVVSYWITVLTKLSSLKSYKSIINLLSRSHPEARRAFWEYFTEVWRILVNMIRISPKRVLAIAQLTLRESIRRKALLVFVVFAVLVMFGGWFLTDANERPTDQVKVHVSFVLTAVTWLSLPVVVLLSCWGLPQDIKNRSLHTVVTKPVQRSEVFIGRVLGFSGIATVIVLVMGCVGYVWILRQVPPEARQALVARVPVYGKLSFTTPTGEPATKGVNTGDVWEFRSYVAGATEASAIWDFKDVSPDLMVVEYDPETGEPLFDDETKEPVRKLVLESSFEAFRTHKGKMGEGLLCEMRIIKDLRFQAAQSLGGAIDRELVSIVRTGDFVQTGNFLKQKANGIESKVVSVSEDQGLRMAAGLADFASLLRPLGNEESPAFPVQKFINAAQIAATGARGSDGKPDTDALAGGLNELGDLFLEHADAVKTTLVDIGSKIATFRVQEYRGDQVRVDRKLTAQDSEGGDITNPDGSDKVYDIFDDLTHGGRLSIAVSLVDQGQYLGMARPDLFIRTPDRPFASGYFKSLVGTWMMLCLIAMIAVTASTFAKGPVAIMLTLTILITGTAMNGFMKDLAFGKKSKQNFGAIESGFRLVEHKNPTVEREDNTTTRVVKSIDKGISFYLKGLAKTVPDLNVFSMSPYVANGFDVPWSAGLLRALGMAIAYLIPCLLIGCFSLSLRELEAK